MADDDFDDGGSPDPFDANAVARHQASQATTALEALVMQQTAIRRRMEAYQRVFKGQPLGDDLNIVMKDLRAFCMGDAAAWHENARKQQVIVGRQEVYYRIKDHIGLSFDDYWEKLTSPTE